jgi:hypothetical protein
MKSKELIEESRQRARAKSKDHNEVLALTLYFLATYVKAARSALMEYALHIYHNELWKAHKPYGKDWRKWVKNAVGKVLTPQEQSLLTNGVPILSYLRRNPIVHGNTTINDETFTNGKLSSFCSALPIISGLNMDSPADQLVFRRIIVAAATMPRSKFRVYLDKQFERRGRRIKVAGKVFYKGNRATVMLTCDKADAAKLLKKLEGIADFAS